MTSELQPHGKVFPKSANTSALSVDPDQEDYGSRYNLHSLGSDSRKPSLAVAESELSHPHDLPMVTQAHSRTPLFWGLCAICLSCSLSPLLACLAFLFLRTPSQRKGFLVGIGLTWGILAGGLLYLAFEAMTNSCQDSSCKNMGIAMLLTGLTCFSIGLLLLVKSQEFNDSFRLTWVMRGAALSCVLSPVVTSVVTRWLPQKSPEQKSFQLGVGIVWAAGAIGCEIVAYYSLANGFGDVSERNTGLLFLFCGILAACNGGLMIWSSQGTEKAPTPSLPSVVLKRDLAVEKVSNFSLEIGVSLSDLADLATLSNSHLVVQGDPIVNLSVPVTKLKT